MRRSILLFAIALAACVAASGGRARGDADQALAGTRPTLYVVSNSHLDTQWNWTVQDSIRDLIPATFRDNFKLFERFPRYTFNFESSMHYQWFKEYHPEEWPLVKKYVGADRWRLSGGWVVAADTHVPSSESLLRQALYGKKFFRDEFGKVPLDVYLPDCFGFSFALPSIARQSGLRAFSTQKLSWGAASPPPFAIGRWKGTDGSTVVAALRAGDYVAQIRTDVSTDPKWNGDLASLGGGSKAGFRYYGVGDQGGAPDAESVGWLEKAIANAASPVRVRNTSADQLVRDLTAAQIAALPEYEGELLLMTHGVGCFTSQAALKRWNRKNELLADAAERASVAASWLGGPAYPTARLREAWTRMLWHQFHDDLTGTSLPQAYAFSWNDELVSMNEFASLATAGAGAVASALDTLGDGVPLVVFNPVAMSRSDLVEAEVRFDSTAPFAVEVVDSVTGAQATAQVVSRDGRTARLAFVADLPPVGFKVFRVLAASPATAPKSTLGVTASSLENERYLVKLDANGDIASVMDKEAGRELLGAPARLELLDDLSARWPAWEILWSEVSRKPRAHPGSPVVRIVERGPARVALEVTRRAEGSIFRQRISLARGGDRVVIDNDVDWRTPGTLLKASFPLAASNARATYDLGVGTIDRVNAHAKAYEVPGQQWADITDRGGAFGVAILNDSKYGWDKPADNTLRLTLIHTPRPDKNYVYQGSNDLGRHTFSYAIAGHRGDWRDGRIPSRASRFNQPPLVFQAASHGGVLGTSFSMLTTSPDGGQVAVRALKLAEDSDEVVVRLQELYGRQARDIGLTLPVAIRSAREVTAAEEARDPVPVVSGRILVTLGPYEGRTFALRLSEATRRISSPESIVVPLPFNADGLSADVNRGDGDFDGKGRTLAAEQVPSSLSLGGIEFQLGRGTPGEANVVVPGGQRVRLPAGAFDSLHLIAASVGGDSSGVLTFERDDAPVGRTTVRVQEWEGAIGQWTSRLQDDRLLRAVFVAPMKDQSWALEAIESQMVVKRAADGTLAGVEQLRPGFVKRDEVALVVPHRHAPAGNEPYIASYLFHYVVEIPKGATSVVLPANALLRILAMSAAAKTYHRTRPAGTLVAPELPGPSSRRRPI